MSILSRLNTKKYAFYSEFQYSFSSLFFFSCSSCDIRLCDVELLAVTGFSGSFFGVTLALLNNPAIALCGVSTLLLLFPFLVVTMGQELTSLLFAGVLGVTSSFPGLGTVGTISSSSSLVQYLSLVLLILHLFLCVTK